MKFKKIVDGIFTSYYSHQNGYTFEINRKLYSEDEKYYVCVQNFNDKEELMKVDCRIPTYLTAWRNIYFDTVEEAEIWSEEYLQEKLYKKSKS